MDPSLEQLEKLAENLEREPRYGHLDLSRLGSLDRLNALERYRPGDLVRVARSGGGWSLGVVMERHAERLRIVLRSRSSGHVSTKDMSAASVRHANPLRIGDFVTLSGTPFWVVGIDGDGELLVLTRDGKRVRPEEVRAQIALELSRIAADGDRTVNLTPTELARLQVGPEPRGPGARPSYAPIESLLGPEGAPGLFAGNKETDTVFNLKSPIAGAALHTNKGHNYKAWNEDGAALFADARGRLFLGVFDQAGGEGSDPHARGAASAIAAEMLFEEMRRVADQGGDDAAAEAGLVRAAQRAHVAIRERGKGEVTTFVGAMIDARTALIVNVGDSRAQHYSADGAHLASTEAQGIGRLLLEGLGMTRKDQVSHASYRWAVSQGDYLVFGSDGLFDSRMSDAEIGALIVAAGNAADATRRLRDEAALRMKARTGKPDNLTVLVVRVGSPAR